MTRVAQLSKLLEMVEVCRRFTSVGPLGGSQEDAEEIAKLEVQCGIQLGPHDELIPLSSHTHVEKVESGSLGGAEIGDFITLKGGSVILIGFELIGYYSSIEAYAEGEEPLGHMWEIAEPEVHTVAYSPPTYQCVWGQTYVTPGEATVTMEFFADTLGYTNQEYAHIGALEVGETLHLDSGQHTVTRLT